MGSFVSMVGGFGIRTPVSLASLICHAKVSGQIMKHALPSHLGVTNFLHVSHEAAPALHPSRNQNQVIALRGTAPARYSKPFLEARLMQKDLDDAQLSCGLRFRTSTLSLDTYIRI